MQTVSLHGRRKKEYVLCILVTTTKYHVNCVQVEEKETNRFTQSNGSTGSKGKIEKKEKEKEEKREKRKNDRNKKYIHPSACRLYRGPSGMRYRILTGSNGITHGKHTIAS